MKRPFPGCYWVIEGHLLAGPNPMSKDPEKKYEMIDALIEFGVKSIINLVENHELKSPYISYLPDLVERKNKMGKEVFHLSYPLKVKKPLNQNYIQTLLNIIDCDMANGKPVYIHCDEGRDRTGLIIGCWLATHGLTGKRALERIDELRAPYLDLAGKASPSIEEMREYVIHFCDVRPLEIVADDGPEKACSFCGNKPAENEKMVSGPGVYICNDCVKLCNEMMET